MLREPRFLFALALWGLVLATPSRAANHSDLWWNPTESGWGIQFVQEADFIAATMYIYDASRNPAWYIATLTPSGGTAFSGPVYQTHGPGFSGPFDPATVTERVVGNMILDTPTSTTGTLTYTIDGVMVVKAIERETLKFEDFTGTYAGALELNNSGCVNPANNGPSESLVFITITQAGASFSTMWTDAVNGFACTLSGTYTQAGRLGSVAGTLSCPAGNPINGNVTLSEMAPSGAGFHANVNATTNRCATSTGRFGGIRRVVN